MERFVFSSPVGVFLFDEQGNLSKKKLFANPREAGALLAANQWTDEEKEMAGTEKILFLGFKNKKIGNVVFTNDSRKLGHAADRLKQHESQAREEIFLAAKRKVKEAVTSDELIIQAASSVADTDRAINMLVKRAREWQGLSQPEMAYNVEDNMEFLHSIGEANRESEMGAVFSEDDKREVEELAKSALMLAELRKMHETYVDLQMKIHLKNVAAVAGSAIGAKLLREAGSLEKLAMMPASKLQLLGAEKSMFKFLRKKSKKMPRFGILHEHKLIASAKEKEKGRMARLLADKITIAARVDYFKGEYAGEKLLAEIKEKSK